MKGKKQVVWGRDRETDGDKEMETERSSQK